MHMPMSTYYQSHASASRHLAYCMYKSALILPALKISVLYFNICYSNLNITQFVGFVKNAYKIY